MWLFIGVVVGVKNNIMDCYHQWKSLTQVLSWHLFPYHAVTTRIISLPRPSLWKNIFLVKIPLWRIRLYQSKFSHFLYFIEVRKQIFFSVSIFWDRLSQQILLSHWSTFCHGHFPAWSLHLSQWKIDHFNINITLILLYYFQIGSTKFVCSQNVECVLTILFLVLLPK